MMVNELSKSYLLGCCGLVSILAHGCIVGCAAARWVWSCYGECGCDVVYHGTMVSWNFLVADHRYFLVLNRYPCDAWLKPHDWRFPNRVVAWLCPWTLPSPILKTSWTFNPNPSTCKPSPLPCEGPIGAPRHKKWCKLRALAQGLGLERRGFVAQLGDDENTYRRVESMDDRTSLWWG